MERHLGKVRRQRDCGGDEHVQTLDVAEIGDGTDAVNSGITFNLADTVHVIGDIENLVLTGLNAINGTGNALANEVLPAKSPNSPSPSRPYGIKSR